MEAKVSEAYNLSHLAYRIRLETLKSIYNAGSGHSGGSFSAAEILSVLYFNHLNIDPRTPDWPDRDRFILSKGHAAPALYTTLALRGFFPVEELATLRKRGSRLSGHPASFKTPGVDLTSGSLGQGLSAGLGMCLAARVLKKDYRVYVLLGDGEIQEGQVWEAAMAAAHMKTRGLVAIVDYNRVQLDGTVGEIMEVEPLADKWRSFGWQVLETDGHDVVAISDSLERADSLSNEGPVVILARTVKGKGVSFMEGRSEWHGKVPDEVLFEGAVNELELVLGGE